MFTLGSLQHAVVGAPMAGGPSTPALAAAVSNAGGLGFLAAGYKSAEATAAEINAVRELTGGGGAYGVNLFVPDTANTAAAGTAGNLAAALAYRTELAGRYPADLLPMPDPADTDGWEAKLDLVRRLQVPVVSFTFGLPGRDIIASLADAGTAVAVTVTTAAEAELAVASGARILCLQGPDAGGHRGSFDAAAEPGDQPLLELVRTVRGLLDSGQRGSAQLDGAQLDGAQRDSGHLDGAQRDSAQRGSAQLDSGHTDARTELIAAGGISTARDARMLRDAGADAVQVGTALLLSPEAGTAAVHRAALQDPQFATTALTRSFSGRTARGLANNFMAAYPHAPAAYPLVNQITRTIRARSAAAGDPHGTSLWAGTGWRNAAAEPAAAVVQRLGGNS